MQRKRTLGPATEPRSSSDQHGLHVLMGRKRSRQHIALSVYFVLSAAERPQQAHPEAI